MPKAVKTATKQNKPDGLNILDYLFGHFAAIEAENVDLKNRVAALEQGLANLTIGAEAVNAIATVTIRSIAQILMSAITPAVPAQSENMAPEEPELAQEAAAQPA